MTPFPCSNPSTAPAVLCTIAAINPATDSRVGKIWKTGHHPERFAIEMHEPMLYANCPTCGNAVLAINRDTGKSTKWHLPGGLSGNYAITFDEADHRLFVNGATKLIVIGRFENRWHGNCVAGRQNHSPCVSTGYAARKPLL